MAFTDGSVICPIASYTLHTSLWKHCGILLQHLQDPQALNPQWGFNSYLGFGLFIQFHLSGKSPSLIRSRVEVTWKTRTNPWGCLSSKQWAPGLVMVSIFPEWHRFLSLPEFLTSLADKVHTHREIFTSEPANWIWLTQISFNYNAKTFLSFLLILFTTSHFLCNLK